MKQVVDASVILAYLLGEPGGELLIRDDASFCLSTVNLSEVLTRIIDRGLLVDDVMRTLKRLPIEILDHNREDARRTAELRLSTRQSGLSLGDRACLALAIRLDAQVVTADKAWTLLDLPIDIRLIR